MVIRFLSLIQDSENKTGTGFSQSPLKSTTYEYPTKLVQNNVQNNLLASWSLVNFTPEKSRNAF